MNDDDWTYQDDNFDEDLPYIELQFGSEDLYVLYESVKYRWENDYESDYNDGHPDEQQRLENLKKNLYRVVLEYKFKMY